MKLQSRFLAIRGRAGGHERRRAKGVPPVHDRVLVAATGRPRQPPPPADGGAQSGRRRGQLPLGQHLRPLPETARVPDRRNSARAATCCHQGKRLPPELKETSFPVQTMQQINIR
jgi:hypothetical protein